VKILHQKRFLQDLAKIPSTSRSSIEKFAFEEILTLKSLAESRKIERMKGYKQYYKVRFGDYRVGLRLDDETVVFERVLNRKDIYRFFP
jgi:mRNA interferase RelE/StbE